MTPCLISQRTGKRCQSCRHGDQHKPGYWKSRYWTKRSHCRRCGEAGHFTKTCPSAAREAA